MCLHQFVSKYPLTSNDRINAKNKRYYDLIIGERESKMKQKNCFRNNLHIHASS